MSPFRKITQQLSALELKSPELEDFATPVVAPPDLWPRTKTPTGAGRPLMRSNSLHLRPSASTLDINAIYNLHRTVKCYNEQLKSNTNVETMNNENQENSFQSLPVHWQNDLNDHNDHELTNDNSNGLQLIDMDELSNPSCSMKNSMTAPMNIIDIAAVHPHFSLPEHDDRNSLHCNMGGFLDTKIMSTSPSANYYRPTEEPEPLDLTQLNIEASVMCLVSKIKFLCGRCGSPAIRLRQPKVNMKRAGFANNAIAPDVVSSQTMLAANGIGNSNEQLEQSQVVNGNGLNLDLTQTTAVANNDVDLRAKKGNKFTDGEFWLQRIGVIHIVYFKVLVFETGF